MVESKGGKTEGGGSDGPLSSVVNVKSFPFWSLKSVRMHFAVMLCFVVLANTMMRNTLSMAILCMVNYTAVQEMDVTSIPVNRTNVPPGCQLTEATMKQYEV
ncbi:unnamed protein product [Soboliphyme baturini]|uniref:TPT domain-containing protein n=1 Tax=Soboliphyme baturini TaxID=241478 RepID=A0A183J454_9BILA|nr:unnamed protein product [Soboliphyme baturini]